MVKTKQREPGKEYELEVGRAIEMLGAEAPMSGDRKMTVGDMIVQMVPSIAADTDKAVRLWRIAMAIDAHKGQFISISDMDFDLLKSTLLSDSRPAWVKYNLHVVFTEAKERAEATKTE